MNIAIVGTGYVGLVSGTCFAEMGVNVTCIDVNKEKIDRLKRGDVPIYEPHLDTMIHKNVKAGRLHFHTDLAQVINDVEIVFSAVGTPPGEDGSADLKYVLEVAKTIGQHLSKYVLVVTKSTVPVGTAQKVRETIRTELHKRDVDVEFDVASNPEFLKEGNAIEDFMKPDRVIIGTDSPRSQGLLTQLYRPLMLNNFRVVFMDIPSAEMTKYAANSMLATRISFMNDIANLCELVGADVNMVRQGIGSDSRIGNKFLYPGCGYGGSCFPKDVKALIKTARKHQYNMQVLEAVEAVNENQKYLPFKKFTDFYRGDIAGKKAAVWGLSFKPETDDMREAPSLILIRQLLQAGCKVAAYDPVATTEARRIMGEVIEYSEQMYAAVEDADVLFLITEWKEFRMPDWEKVRSLMRKNLIVDGRNIFDAQRLEQNGFIYKCIGK